MVAFVLFFSRPSIHSFIHSSTVPQARWVHPRRCTTIAPPNAAFHRSGSAEHCSQSQSVQRINGQLQRRLSIPSVDNRLLRVPRSQARSMANHGPSYGLSRELEKKVGFTSFCRSMQTDCLLYSEDRHAYC